jgi:hypothetical protein
LPGQIAWLQAYIEDADAQIGRLVQFLRRHDLLDDTMIVLLSDNGASGEGGATGSINEYRYFLGLPDDVKDRLEMIDEIGGPLTHNHYPRGWAQAGNTPLKFYKKHTYGGGVRAPLIVHWPNHVPDPGSVRSQFHHVIDIAPTLLDVAGADAPQTYRGVSQLPMHGTSMAYTFRNAAEPSTRTLQYFETAGHRGLYRNGFKIVTNHESGTDFDDDRFELYYLDDDIAEVQDLAGERPDLVADLVDEWWKQADHYGVLPLDDRMQERVTSRDPASERDHYGLLPGARIPNGSAGPIFADRPFTITAKFGSGPGGPSSAASDPTRDGRSMTGPNLGDGVLLAYGRRAAGFSFFVQHGRLVFDLNLAGRHSVVESSDPVPAGVAAVSMSLELTGGKARVVFFADGMKITEAYVPSALPAGLGCLSTQCGYNSPSPVSPRYTAPFRFTGDLHDVTIEFRNDFSNDSSGDAMPATEASWRAALGRE